MSFPHITFLIVCILASLHISAQQPASVYITAGQSNADGRATCDHLPSCLRGGYSHLRYADVISHPDGQFGDRLFGKRFAFCDITNYLIDQASTEPFYSIKCAVGGTAIDSAANAGKRPSWCAYPQWLANHEAYLGSKSTGQSLAKALADGFDRCAHTTLDNLPNGYRVKAIMWHQGESDRHHAHNYYRNLRQLITYLRERISQTTGRADDKHLPFIIGTVPRHSRQYSAEVERAHRQLATDLPQVYVIDMSDASLLPDNLHLDSAATHQLGKLMYQQLVELRLAPRLERGGE